MLVGFDSVETLKRVAAATRKAESADLTGKPPAQRRPPDAVVVVRATSAEVVGGTQAGELVHYGPSGGVLSAVPVRVLSLAVPPRALPVSTPLVGRYVGASAGGEPVYGVAGAPTRFGDGGAFTCSFRALDDVSGVFTCGEDGRPVFTLTKAYKTVTITLTDAGLTLTEGA